VFATCRPWQGSECGFLLTSGSKGRTDSPWTHLRSRLGSLHCQNVPTVFGRSLTPLEGSGTMTSRSRVSVKGGLVIDKSGEGLCHVWWHIRGEASAEEGAEGGGRGVNDARARRARRGAINVTDKKKRGDHSRCANCSRRRRCNRDSCATSTHATTRKLRIPRWWGGGEVSVTEWPTGLKPPGAPRASRASRTRFAHPPRGLAPPRTRQGIRGWSLIVRGTCTSSNRRSDPPHHRHRRTAEDSGEARGLAVRRR
jgi:hypothetical protein